MVTQKRVGITNSVIAFSLILLVLSSCGSTSKIEGKWISTHISRGSDLASFEFRTGKLTVTTADGLVRSSRMIDADVGTEFEFTEENSGLAKCTYVSSDTQKMTVAIRRSNTIDTLHFFRYTKFNQLKVKPHELKVLLSSSLWIDTTFSYQFFMDESLITKRYPPDSSGFRFTGYEIYNFDSLLFLKTFSVGGNLYNVRINSEQSIDLWEVTHNVVIPLKKDSIYRNAMETQGKLVNGSWEVAGNPIPPPMFRSIQFRYDPMLPTFDAKGMGIGEWTMDYTGQLVILRRDTKPTFTVLQIKKISDRAAKFCERGSCFEYRKN